MTTEELKHLDPFAPPKTKHEQALMDALGIARQLRDDPLLDTEENDLKHQLVLVLVSALEEPQEVPF